MVHANYCAPYPKQPCVVHKVNMWYPYYMMSSVFKYSPKSRGLSCGLTLVVLKIEKIEK